jgi:hypothetical protein
VLILPANRASGRRGGLPEVSYDSKVVTQKQPPIVFAAFATFDPKFRFHESAR